MNMTGRDYLKAYEQAVLDHGGGAFDATLWSGPESQQIRFAAMLQMIEFKSKRVLDAGCGRGDFAKYMWKQGVKYAQFIGVDGLGEVIDFANQRKLKHATFHAGDFVREPELLKIGDPQIITFSGTLNTMPLDLATQVLDHAWQATSEALIFNFLASTAGKNAPPQEYPAKRLDTFALLRFAFERTWAVQFRQDYFHDGHDATILMIKA